MSEAPDEDAPTMDELDRVAFDAVVRNAPRFGRFIGTGVAIGATVGIVIGLALPNTLTLGRAVVALLVGAGFAMIGGIVAAGIVVGLDGTRKAPPQSGFPWEAPEPSVDADVPSVGQEEAK